MNQRRCKVRNVERTKLIQIISDTYDDSHFGVGIGAEEDCDFFSRLQINRSGYYSKDLLLKAVQVSERLEFPIIDDHLIINERLFVYPSHLDQNQSVPPTPNADSFVHCICKYNPHFDVYYRFDHEKKCVTFALGKLRKEVRLIEYTEWTRKIVKGTILCSTSKDLEAHFEDEFWNPIAVRYGRKLLGIKPLV